MFPPPLPHEMRFDGAISSFGYSPGFLKIRTFQKVYKENLQQVFKKPHEGFVRQWGTIFFH